MLDPYPFIYYPNEKLYVNLLTGEINTSCNVNEGNFGTLNIKLDNSRIILHTYAVGVVYKIIFDVATKTIIQKISLGKLSNFNLTVVADENGNSIFFPIDNSEDNYFYFER